jgi:hypothetical protein
VLTIDSVNLPYKPVTPGKATPKPATIANLFNDSLVFMVDLLGRWFCAVSWKLFSTE